MRTAPVPILGPAGPPAHVAAAQTTDLAPTSTVLSGRGSMGVGTMGGSDRDLAASYADWISNAKYAARAIGVARFAANLFASTAARVRLTIEYLADDGTWQEVDDQRRLLDGYRNDTLNQGPPELLRLHTWHYQVAGEGLIVAKDNGHGEGEWLIISTRSVDWDRPAKGAVTCKVVPAGEANKGTAFVVPRRQVVRFWMPDEEYVALPVSPMTAAMEDLKRWLDLARYARRTARSYLALNGLLWTPKKAHEVDEDESEVADVPDDLMDEAVAETAKRDPLVELYDKVVKAGIDRDDRLESVAPTMVWWGEKGDEPKWIDIGKGLDEQGIAHRQEALHDFGRSIDAPGGMIAAGGSAEENHWNEWLNEARFHGSVAPLLDRVTHSDLTTFFLVPNLRIIGVDPSRYRIGYDPTDVVVHPDRSDDALRAWLAGLLGRKAALKHLGFDEEELADESDLEVLGLVLSRFGATTGMAPQVTTGEEAPEVGPADGNNVDVGPPEGPPSNGEAEALGLAANILGPYLPGVPPPIALPAARTAATVAVEEIPEVDRERAGAHRARARGPLNDAQREIRERTGRYRAVLDRLARLRRDTGRRLLAGAEVALADAIRLVGVRVTNKARNKAKSTGESIVAALDAGQPPGPFLSALGITEEQVLAGSFDSYEAQAEVWLSERREQERRMLADAGFDPDVYVPEDDRADEEAAAFLAAALMALARQRIMGDPATVDTPGEVTGIVPARLTADAIRISDGLAVVQHPGTADLIPSVHRTQSTTVEEQIRVGLREDLIDSLTSRDVLTDEATQAIDELGQRTTEYAWVHGFYGDPLNVFEPHVDLDGYVTTEPEVDDRLTNDEAFPDGPFYTPGDHPGCTCEWVALVADDAEGPLVSVLGGGEA